MTWTLRFPFSSLTQSFFYFILSHQKATFYLIVDLTKLNRIATRLGFPPSRSFSFPLPRCAGWLFPFNEFVVVSTKEAQVAYNAPEESAG